MVQDGTTSCTITRARVTAAGAKTALPDSVIGIRLEDFIAEVIL
jgi:hypothetical protein